MYRQGGWLVWTRIFTKLWVSFSLQASNNRILLHYKLVPSSEKTRDQLLPTGTIGYMHTPCTAQAPPMLAVRRPWDTIIAHTIILKNYLKAVLWASVTVHAQSCTAHAQPQGCHESLMHRQFFYFPYEILQKVFCLSASWCLIICPEAFPRDAHSIPTTTSRRPRNKIKCEDLQVIHKKNCGWCCGA